MKRLVPLALVLLAGCGPSNAQLSQWAERCNERGGVLVQVNNWNRDFQNTAPYKLPFLCARPDTISLAIPQEEK